MTVIALVRGIQNTFNALVADTGVGEYGKHGKAIIGECEHDKIHRAFDHTYVSVVGDALVLDALRELVSWLDPQRPNMRDPATVNAVLAGVERLRRIKQINKQGFAPDPKTANLVVCSRSEAFLWESNFDVTTGLFSRPTKPTEVHPGKSVVIWGTTLAWLNDAPIDPQSPFTDIVDYMFQVDRQIQEKGFHLPYTLKTRCSGVMLPHDSKDPLVRMRPFDSLPEQMAKFYGGEAMSLLSDPQFMAFP